MKNIFIRNENDANATKLGIGLVLVLFTAVLYGKTYFALRKQARSMIGKKSKFSPKQRQYSMEKKNCIESENREVAQYQDNTVQNGSKRAKCQSERTQSFMDERAENQNHRAEKQNDRSQNDCERTEIENERAKCHSERAQSLDERAESRNHRAEKVNDRAQSQSQCGEIDNERAKNHNQGAQNKNERAGSENERAQREDLFSNKRPKNFQVMNNTKEQKFLNTIIIIACIAVVTVMPRSIYTQLRGTGVSSDTNSILVVVGGAIFCLNFAANPFVYCLRSKRYRKTFKMVYGCKH